MPRGVRVAVYDGKQRSWNTRDFPQFPVRVGRNNLNDLQLDHAGVSQFHAIIEVHGGELMVRDLGSKNGTVVQGLGRLPPNAPSSIAVSNGEFVIVNFLMRAKVVDLPDTVQISEGPLANAMRPSERVERTVRSEALLKERIDPLYREFRESWGRLFEVIQTSVSGMDDDPRQALCADLLRTMPALATEPDFVHLTNPIPVEEGSIVSSKSPVAKSAIALQAFGHLAGAYFPNGSNTLDTPEDLAIFAQNVKETLDVFFKCFIPLREGFRALTTQLELPPGRGEGTPMGVRTGVPSVEDAATPEQLAAAMLDWRRTPKADAKQSIEWVFADLMIHQMAMMTGVMQGVKSLLGELAPSAIEKALDDPRRNQGGLQIGPFRYKQLWELYATRHADLAEEDKEAFAVIFGPEFARAYTRLASDTVATRAFTDYPTRTGTPSFRPPGST